MANRFAVASGNFNDTATWSTTAAGSPGASVPQIGDNAIANGRTVAITANVSCDNITNGTSFGGSGGGGFTINTAVTITAGIIFGTGALPTLACNSSIIINGPITGGDSSSNPFVLNITGGTLIINGNITKGKAISNLGTCQIIGEINVTNATTQACITNNAVLTISESVTGGGNALGGVGIVNGPSATVTISKNVNAGSIHPAVTNTTGTVVVNGSLTAVNGVNALTSSGIVAEVRLSGSFFDSPNGTAAVYCARYYTSSTPLLSRRQVSLNGINSSFSFWGADNTGLGPATSDVRAGTTYAGLTGTCAVPPASSVAFGVPVGATTGTAVLTAAAIRAELSTELERIDAAISSRLEPSGTLARVTLTDTATTLTNAPTVPSVVQIRQEMDANSTKLANLDTTVSSRLAPSGTLATVTNLTNAPTSVTPSDIWSHASRTLTSASGPTAAEIRQEIDANSTKLDAAVSSRMAASEATKLDSIKGKTDLLNTDRLSQVATTNIVGVLLAQANS